MEQRGRIGRCHDVDAEPPSRGGVEVTVDEPAVMMSCPTDTGTGKCP
jgi:hypothetical protein